MGRGNLISIRGARRDDRTRLLWSYRIGEKMIELLKAAVIHKTFGAGKIKAVENGHVVITFGASDSEEPTEKNLSTRMPLKTF